MKQGMLLQSELSYTIAKMGHMDSLTIGDAGLPIPEGVSRIDLAVTQGIPGFLDVLEAVLSELKVERVLLAKEMVTVSPDLHEKTRLTLTRIEKEYNRTVEIEYVDHQDFKNVTATSKAVVRTGEFTPYANIILVSGVVF